MRGKLPGGLSICLSVCVYCVCVVVCVTVTVCVTTTTTATECLSNQIKSRLIIIIFQTLSHSYHVMSCETCGWEWGVGTGERQGLFFSLRSRYVYMYVCMYVVNFGSPGRKGRKGGEGEYLFAQVPGMKPDPHTLAHSMSMG